MLPRRETENGIHRCQRERALTYLLPPPSFSLSFPFTYCLLYAKLPDEEFIRWHFYIMNIAGRCHNNAPFYPKEKKRGKICSLFHFGARVIFFRNKVCIFKLTLGTERFQLMVILQSPHRALVKLVIRATLVKILSCLVALTAFYKSFNKSLSHTLSKNR